MLDEVASRPHVLGITERVGTNERVGTVRVSLFPLTPPVLSPLEKRFFLNACRR